MEKYHLTLWDGVGTCDLTLWGGVKKCHLTLTSQPDDVVWSGAVYFHFFGWSENGSYDLGEWS